ncbi:MAG TPA: CbtA family protein [Arenibaculum sp.]|nr:CbtA family protein [Arenibaculum sp.]
MFRRVFLAALAAGLIVGVLVTAMQAVTTTPLILQAEVFEAAGGGHSHGHAHDHDHGHDHGVPESDAGRLLTTLLANLVTGVGFALLLVAAFALRGQPVDERRGLLWGVAGFAVFTLAPSLGLPPEIPGSAAADLAARQAWWAFAAVGAAAGLWLLVFGRHPVRLLLGISVAALPHLVGAPVHDAASGNAPPELAAQFAATAIVVSALFWAALGWTAGSFYRRLT